MKISVDYTGRTFVAILWHEGYIVEHLKYVHPFRLEWGKPELYQACAKLLKAAIDSWSESYGPPEESAINRGLEARRKAALIQHSKNELWRVDLRNALYDVLKEFSTTIYIKLDDDLRQHAVRMSNKIQVEGKRTHILRTAVQVGLQAGYHSKSIERIHKDLEETAGTKALGGLLALLEGPEYPPSAIKQMYAYLGTLSILAKKKDMRNRIADCRASVKEIAHMELQDQRAEIEAIKLRLREAGVQ